MSPNTLRVLDRWLGLPLCAMLSGIRRIFRRLAPRPPADSPPRRILFVQVSEGGSLILAAPALLAIRQGGAEAWFVASADNAPVLVMAGLAPASRIFVLSAAGIFGLLRQLVALRAFTRAAGIDAVVDLELFPRLSAALCFLVGVGRRAGFHADEGGALYRGHLFTDPVRFDPQDHLSENYRRLVAPLLSPPAGSPAAAGNLQVFRPNATVDPAVDALLRQLPESGHGRLVLVNANASERLPQRRWPEERFAETIEMLLAIRPDVSVLLIGDQDDRPVNRRVLDALGHYAGRRCHDFAGLVPLCSLPSLLARASLLISNDSGPAHFAAVTALPVVVLFGPETPKLFAPLGPASVITARLPCSPCVSPANQRKSSCRDNRCMQEIPTQAVVNEALRLLARAPAKNPARASG